LKLLFPLLLWMAVAYHPGALGSLGSAPGSSSLGDALGGLGGSLTGSLSSDNLGVNPDSPAAKAAAANAAAQAANGYAQSVAAAAAREASVYADSTTAIDGLAPHAADARAAAQAALEANALAASWDGYVAEMAAIGLNVNAQPLGWDMPSHEEMPSQEEDNEEDNEEDGEEDGEDDGEEDGEEDGEDDGFYSYLDLTMQQKAGLNFPSRL